MNASFLWYPSGSYLEKKWWHRLAKVLIWGISALFLVFSFLLTSVALEGSTEKRYIYNFERGYSSNSGYEQQLNKYNKTYDLVSRITTASKDQSPTDREWVPKENVESVFEEQRAKGKLDYEIGNDIVSVVESGTAARDIKIKTWYVKHYFPSLFLLLLSPVMFVGMAWVYRIILYIGFGKKLPT